MITGHTVNFTITYPTRCHCPTGECRCGVIREDVSGTGAWITIPVTGVASSFLDLARDQMWEEWTSDDTNKILELRRAQMLRSQRIQARLEPPPLRPQLRPSAPRHVPTKWLLRKHS